MDATVRKRVTFATIGGAFGTLTVIAAALSNSWTVPATYGFLSAVAMYLATKRS
jgi:hypothetical protein